MRGRVGGCGDLRPRVILRSSLRGQTPPLPLSWVLPHGAGSSAKGTSGETKASRMGMVTLLERRGGREHSAPTRQPWPLLLLTGRLRPGAGISLPYFFPSVFKESPRRPGPHRGSGSQSKTEGEEGVVPAAPGEFLSKPWVCTEYPWSMRPCLARPTCSMAQLHGFLFQT